MREHAATDPETRRAGGDQRRAASAGGGTRPRPRARPCPPPPRPRPRGHRQLGRPRSARRTPPAPGAASGNGPRTLLAPVIAAGTSGAPARAPAARRRAWGGRARRDRGPGCPRGRAPAARPGGGSSGRSRGRPHRICRGGRGRRRGGPAAGPARLEQLGLAHEAQVAPVIRRDEERVPEALVVGGHDRRALRRDVLRAPDTCIRNQGAGTARGPPRRPRRAAADTPFSRARRCASSLVTAAKPQAFPAARWGTRVRPDEGAANELDRQDHRQAEEGRRRPRRRPVAA